AGDTPPCPVTPRRTKQRTTGPPGRLIGVGSPPGDFRRLKSNTIAKPSTSAPSEIKFFGKVWPENETAVEGEEDKKKGVNTAAEEEEEEEEEE
ncbi:hypothetical protein K0M31_013384, partial [Melipona bicolor]